MKNQKLSILIQIITLVTLGALCVNKYLFSLNLFLVFIYLLATSFVNYNSSKINNIVHISWISICAGIAIFSNTYIIEVIFIAIAPFSLILDMFKAKKMKLFRWIQLLDILVFMVAILLYKAGHVQSSVLLTITAVLIRQAQFPFHIWIHEIKNNRELFPSVAFLCLSQTGFIIYASTMLHNVHNAILHQFVPGLTLATGLILAIYALKEKDSLTKHLLIIMSQSCLPLAAYHSFSTTSAIGGLLFAMVVALSGTVFCLFSYHFYMQKNIHTIDRYYSLYRRNKNLAAIYFVTGFSVVGLPLTVGYIAEDILFHGIIQTATYIALLYIIMSAINGYTVFYLFNRLFFGHTQKDWKLFYQTKMNKFFIGIATILITFGVIFIGKFSSSIEKRLEESDSHTKIHHSVDTVVYIDQSDIK